MTNDNKNSGSERYGPADVTCPYCGEEVHVEAGPTKLCEIDHCGEWMIVDLEAEAAGHTNSDALRADGGRNGCSQDTGNEQNKSDSGLN